MPRVGTMCITSPSVYWRVWTIQPWASNTVPISPIAIATAALRVDPWVIMLVMTSLVPERRLCKPDHAGVSSIKNLSIRLILIVDKKAPLPFPRGGIP